MLFIQETITTEQLNEINNFFIEFDREIETVTPEAAGEETTISKYITSLADGAYSKSVDDIANTKIGNRIVRKRNLQQVMRESFFYGANRFGNNFIA